MSVASNKSLFWQNVFAPINFEVDADIDLEGASGLVHRIPVVGLSHDESTFVVVVSDPDPTKAILISNDLKARHPDKNFITLRPTIGDAKDMVLRVGIKLLELGFDKEKIAAEFQGFSGLFADLEGASFQVLTERSKGTLIEDELRAAYFSREVTGISLFESGVHFIREFMLLDVFKAFEGGKFDPIGFLNKKTYSNDILAGGCALPLQKLAETDWEAFLGQQSSDRAAKFMKESGVYQFFKPPADHAVLGLVEKGLSSSSGIEEALQRAAEIGHKIDQPELVSGGVNLSELIENLRKSGLTLKGDVEVELSPEGMKQRTKVQFEPREGFFFRLLRHLPHLREGVGAVKDAKSLVIPGSVNGDS